jgi:hypothetical protein
MYKHACKTGFEGVVSKVRDSRYASGRTNDWVKKTCAQRALPIAGFALDGNKCDGLYLGRRKGKDLIYAGKVDHGFDTAAAKDLQARLKPLIRKTQPYAKKWRTAACGSSHRCSPKSNIAPSRQRERCGIRSLRVFGTICDTMANHGPFLRVLSGDASRRCERWHLAQRFHP